MAEAAPMRKEKLIIDIIQRAEKSGIESERIRIAGELHDSIAQQLALINMYVRSIETLEPGTEVFSRYLLELKSMVEQSEFNVRKLAHDMRPEEPLSACLDNKIMLHTDRYNLLNGTKLKYVRGKRIVYLTNKDDENGLFCVIQEFINNSIKHAGATLIDIRLKRLKNKLKISLSDNGRGFDIDKKTHSFGVNSINQRLKDLNAHYDFNSIIGSGTVLTIEINE